MTPSSDELEKDGGPAFPVPIGSQHDAGISQRQYFAGQALVGLLAGKRRSQKKPLAEEAFEIADLMLAEGRRRPEG